MVLARKNSPTLTLTKPHKGGQRAIYRHPARFQIVACGRRFGKTEFGKLIVSEALFRYHTEVWYIAPTYKMSSRVWRDFRFGLAPFATDVSAQDRMMWFPGGDAMLAVWSGEAGDTMRGGAPGLVVIDEAAMITDPELWQAVIRPALTDRRGRAVFLSTPRGRNWFWDLFMLGLDPLEPNYKSWNFPSWNNPALPAGEIEEAKRGIPERLFDQEYAAKFLEDAGGVFRRVSAAAYCAYMEPYEGDFVFGVDWGRSHDYTVISVIDRRNAVQVDLDRFSGIGWPLQRQRLVNMYHKWNPSLIVAEYNSFGGPNVEVLQAEGLPVRPFTMTSTNKGPLIEALAGAIERSELGLLNDRIQTAELQAYEFERSASGMFKYNAPAGAHDDTVIALALAYEGITSSVWTGVW